MEESVRVLQERLRNLRSTFEWIERGIQNNQKELEQRIAQKTETLRDIKSIERALEKIKSD